MYVHIYGDKYALHTYTCKCELYNGARAKSLNLLFSVDKGIINKQ